MRDFFGEQLLLHAPTAEKLYESVKDLPIIDYHCHLDEKMIRDNHAFSDIGELWLAGDHYKWRAMRLCGVDEFYITGKAAFHQKYLKYAEIFPRLCGNPLYYWTQLELKLLFGITDPLNAQSAERIYSAANEKLSEMRVGDILEKFKVEFVATTDDPASPLDAHGTYGKTAVCPTFRPDAVLNLDPAALSRLEKVTGKNITSLSDLLHALLDRLDFFRSKGCRISDHGMDFLPVAKCGDERAAALFDRREHLTGDEKRELTSYLLYFLAGAYARNGMVMQLHFATFRRVNSGMTAVTGADSGFDIMRGNVDTDLLIPFFDTLASANCLPKTVLYSLNPGCVPALAALSGAFPDVRIGAAWWFNDTVLGIRKQLETVAEYAVLGTNLGMLTDSRSFSSYARFDFFRRILADFVGEYVERGEYEEDAAYRLMYDICYGNIHSFLAL